jgi:hypothetical protein
MSWEDHESKRMEPAEGDATWTGSPRDVFAERKDHKPRLALNNNTAEVREPCEWSGGPSDIKGKVTRVGASESAQRTSFNRTRVAGNLDEIQGVAANTLNGARGEWSHWDASDMDGQTREGEVFRLKPNQPGRHRWESRRPNERERMSQRIF